MDKFLIRVFVALMVVLSLFTLGLVFVVVMDYTTVAEGRVVEKYYDDQDLVCSKGCTIHPECWTIVLEGEPWWNERLCVSKTEYDSINIGDFYTEAPNN